MYFFPFIFFAWLTGFTASSALPVLAGGCINHMNKTAKIKCAPEDTECQTKKTEKFDLEESVKSWDMTQINLVNL